MRYSENFNKAGHLQLYIIVGAVFWTCILYSLYLWAVTAERQHFTETVKLRAESIANHTQALRRWIGGHGGIYVEVVGKITPNPLLLKVPERDIDTPSGRKLTLLNSPSVLRKISPSFKSDQGDRIQLVSNYPLNPSNIADEWEKNALERLDMGASKVGEFIIADEKSSYRLIYPMKLEQKCLKCHHPNAGISKKIIGGLSVTVDKTPYDLVNGNALRQIRIGYLGIWILGILALIFFDFMGVRLLRRIEIIASHDSLTQLYNRREIERHIDLECERAERYESNLSVLLLDIDFFKKVNDTHGHPAGDEALRLVADVIRKTTREIDIAGRYGGEEFLILLPGTSCDHAKKIAKRLKTNIKSTPITIGSKQTISLSASIGISTYSIAYNSSEVLVKRADEALYQAKVNGRDRICVSDES